MKRALAALAAILLATCVEAKTYDVVVIDSRWNIGSTLDQNVRENPKETLAILTRILRQSGTDFTIVPSTLTYTEYARNGLFPRTGGVTDSARCVIVNSMAPRVAGTTVGGFRPDTLMRVAKGGAAVPMCFLIDSTPEMEGNGQAQFDDAASAAMTCSTGVYGVKVATTTWPYTTADPTMRWRFMSYVSGYVRNPTSPAGGLRTVLSGATPEFIKTSKSATNSQFPTSMSSVDVAGGSLGADTMFVWDRLWRIASLPNAKTMTFVSWGGAGYFIGDSLANNYGALNGERAERGMDILMYGLAHFDSLTLAQTGRRLVFGNAKPKRLALMVDGGLVRNLRRINIGINPGDTTSFYSTLDSLSASDIPVTFGINVDSAAAYPRDLIKFNAMRRARFSPQVWTGVMDTSSAGNLPSRRFVDVLGRWRQRTFVGPGTYAGSDSSIYSGLKAAKAVCDSLFPGKSSTFLMPPMDDYSPINLRPNSASVPGSPSKVDSLLYAIRAAGFNGIRINGKYTDSDARYRGAAVNPKGWHSEAGRYRNSIDGRWLTLLQHNGYELEGGISWANSWTDSVAPYDSGGFGRQVLERAMGGILGMDGAMDADVWDHRANTEYGFYAWRNVRYVYEDFQDPVFPVAQAARFTRAQVYTLSCSDLSGRQPDPARTGWLAIRWLDSLFKAVNAAAGKTLLMWSYPEDIEP